MINKINRTVVVIVLGLTLALLWLPAVGMPGAAHAQGPDGHNTYYVAPGGSCGGMTPCFSSVQNAVDAADDSGDVVKVAAGTYTGVSTRNGLTQMAYINKSLTIRGGYTTSNWNTPDPAANQTTLDAQGQGRVLVISGNIAPTIEGLHITGGNADGLGGHLGFWDAGGGVLVYTATVTIGNCVIHNNTANTTNVGYGGGLYLSNSDATLIGNTVTANTVTTDPGGNGSGGGVYLHYSSDAALNGNNITFNTAKYGGGLYFSYSDAILSESNVTSNTAFADGGGVHLSHSDALISNNHIVSNTSLYWDGGGMSLAYSDAKLSGNTIRLNAADDDGGGLYLYYSNATFTNTIIADNKAGIHGGGLFIRASSPKLFHTTIARNSGGFGTGVYVTDFNSNTSTVALTNTILVSHTTGIYVRADVTTINTARMEATLWGSGVWANGTDWSGNVTHTDDYYGNPVFMNPDNGKYHIGPTSAARDKGVDTSVDSDIDGDSRPFGVKPDLGADEVAVTLTLRKTAPATALPGDPITYTLTVTNSGDISATEVVITDTLPTGASYVSGGTLMPGNVISWTAANLVPDDDMQVQFVVTATQDIANSDYRVSCAEGASAAGAETVVTKVGESTANSVFLPIILKN